MRRLVVIEGRAVPLEVEVRDGLAIGRARNADLRLLDETASRRHARIQEVDGRTVLEDLGSANGVFLNGERIDGRAALFDGDVLQIGDVRLRYGSADDADRSTRAVSSEHVAASLSPDAADPASEAGDAHAVRRLRFVCDAAQVFADAADGSEVPAALVALCDEAFAPERAVVVLLASGGGERVAASQPSGASPPTSTTLRRRVLEDGDAVLVRDAHDVRRHGDAHSMVVGRYRSTLAAPLAVAEGVLGWIALDADEPDRWGEADLAALAAVARQAALALRNLHTLSTARAVAQRSTSQRGAGPTLMLGDAPALVAVRERIAKAAAVSSPVLVTGETGTGKELVARMLHEQGPRASAPFVALNCAALVEGLLESELFGHEKGAFTGAVGRHEGRIVQAGEGTLFLDEMGDLPATLQAKLLRVLSEGTFTRVGGSETLTLRCRLVAATNRDLRAQIAAKAFREDLYYRLAVVEVHLPPLREREADVIVIAEAAVERLAASMGRRPPRLAADVREALRGYPWPGNVRELLNVLERALVLLEGDTITAVDLPLVVSGGRSGADGSGAPQEVLTLREAERRTVIAAIRATGGVKGRAAEALGVSWPTLNRKIREYGLDAEVEQARAAGTGRSIGD